MWGTIYRTFTCKNWTVNQVDKRENYINYNKEHACATEQMG
jgi:hypothetical protein